jgi:hypothetical protein
MKAIALVILLVGADAMAQAPTAIPSKDFIIDGAAAGFDINVSPTYVSSFYFPEEVVNVVFSNKQDFVISRGDRSVVLQPKAKVPLGTKANMAIETKSLKINLNLTVSDQNSVTQSFFKQRKVEEEFDQRVKEEVERQVKPLQEALDAKQRELSTEIRKASEKEIAEGMLRQFTDKRIYGVGRTDDNVIVRVTRSVVVGPSVYVHFDIQNRSDRVFTLDDVQAEQLGKPSAGRLFFAGKVDGGKRANGIIVLSSAQLKPGKPVALSFVSGQRAALKVADLNLD